MVLMSMTRGARNLGGGSNRAWVDALPTKSWAEYYYIDRPNLPVGKRFGDCTHIWGNAKGEPVPVAQKFAHAQNANASLNLTTQVMLHYHLECYSLLLIEIVSIFSKYKTLELGKRCMLACFETLTGEVEVIFR